ncbi:hypothetical protein HD597_001735 [Nonomuraea thailandensis]|uniref:Uncharacterized protein n=1 Tax=Nonomuraea thailandensis TaxID=1188745 RepID=A0A9X2K0E3_9ACTN|nr:hypothetical protein [Nonomuraea thailandensis]MCP2354715.1 hypothetical protein [Nonomuraea thailandensis]
MGKWCRPRSLGAQLLRLDVLDEREAIELLTRLTHRAYLELLRDRPAVMYHRTARGSDAERTIARI